MAKPHILINRNDRYSCELKIEGNTRPENDAKVAGSLDRILLAFFEAAYSTRRHAHILSHYRLDKQVHRICTLDRYGVTLAPSFVSMIVLCGKEKETCVEERRPAWKKGRRA